MRLPYSFSRGQPGGMVRSVAGDPPCSSVVALCFTGATARLNAPFTLRQIDRGQFEQRLNAVWQRDSSEARQLMEDLGSPGLFYLAEELPETEDLLESDDDAPDHQTDQRHAGRGNQKKAVLDYPHRDV